MEDQDTSEEITTEKIQEVPKQWLQSASHYILGLGNVSMDFRKPHLRASVADVYPLFIILYSAIVVFGTLSNLAVVVHIFKHGLHRDPTYCFLTNAAVSDAVKCVFVLPITLMVLLVENWVFGQFLCFFLPMLQDIPIHVSMLTFLLTAIDRYRLIRDPNKPRVPAFVCAVGTWLLAVCIVLPYPIYLTYVDLGEYYKEDFEGVGLCMVNLADDMQEYMRALFLIMYAAPLAAISYLYVRVSRELQVQEGPLPVIMFEARSRDSRCRVGSHSTTTDFRGSHLDTDSQYSRSSYRSVRDHPRYDLYEAELDVYKEKRNQKYLISIVTMFAICLCPLMVLRLARHTVRETYENSGHFDITYTMFVWVGFLPTCTTPWLFASWQMSRSAKERLRGYFRFSNRKLRRSREAVITGAGAAKDGVRSGIQNRLGVGYGAYRNADNHSDSNSLQQDFPSS